MQKLKLKFRDSTINLAIVICAAVAYTVTISTLKKNVIQYSSLPREISMKIFDDAKKDSIIFNLPVVSKLKIDSLTKASAAGTLIERNILFHENPIFLIWMILVSIMITIAAGALPFFIALTIQLKIRFELNRYQMSAGIFFGLILALFLFLSTRDLPGYYHPPHILRDFHILLHDENLLTKIVAATMVLVIPSFIVVFLVGFASDNISLKKTLDKMIVKEKNENNLSEEELIKRKKDAIEKVAKHYDFLSQALKSVLQILAIIVVFSVLTSSALRASVKAVVEIKYYDICPIEISYAYGIYFSLFLCVIYIPAYIFLKRRYDHFRESAITITDIKDEQWFQSVLDNVKFETSPLENLKLSLTVLAPLLSSFLPGFDFFK